MVWRYDTAMKNITVPELPEESNYVNDFFSEIGQLEGKSMSEAPFGKKWCNQVTFRMTVIVMRHFRIVSVTCDCVSLP